jgi:hypothetical protein
MNAQPTVAPPPGPSAGRVLGQKLDSIPFSPHYVLMILVLALIGFIEGYDLAVTGSLQAPAAS